MSKLLLVIATSVFCFASSAPTGSFNGNSTQPNVCLNGNIVYPTSNQTFSFPSNWSENQTAPALEIAPKCSWLVTIPQGFFAKVYVGGEVSKLTLVDAVGNIDQPSNDTSAPYYFVAPKFSIALSNYNSNGTFGFRVVWAPLPTINENSFVNFTALVRDVSSNSTGFTVGSGSRVSILPIPSNPSNPISLRSVIAFQGESTSDQYINNLYRIFQSGEQLASYGQAITIVNLEASNSSDVVVIQNFQYTKDIHEYKGFTCAANSTCTALVNSGFKSSAAVSVGNSTEVLTSVRMDENASLTVYYGSTSDACKVAHYRATQIQQLLPLTFMSNCTQYVVSSGKAYLEINKV